ncbi:hypothetical protein [Uliginosibacterium gangwonense]|uniref:hypothetical protein n=1 Tax=Uliginosibacterium gangwonense TaxID=392736 RepID=UPI00037EA5EC|nr:hypothetical protein [Uliginosibacterium gangwonense]
MNMLTFLSHLDLMPLLYGIIIFLGLWSMWHKLRTLRLVSFCVEAGVFWLVFSLHGGTMAGGFAATVAALLAGRIFRPRKNV